MLGTTRRRLGLRPLHLTLTVGVIAVLRASPEACGESASGGGQSGTANAAADPHLKKVLSFVDEVLGNAGDTERRKVNAIMIVEARSLRQYQPQLERLMKEDASPVVRAKARHTLEFWQSKDAEVAERKAKEEAIHREFLMTPQERERERLQGEKQFVLMLRDQILQKLQSEKPEERRDVMGSAQTWSKHLPETIPILYRLARTDPNPNIRLHALVAILRVRRDSPETLALLQESLGPQNPSMVRSLAADTICGRGDKAGLAVLIDQLNTDNVRFQAFTMKCLRGTVMKGDIGPSPKLLTKAEKPNEELSDDEVRQIREGAAAWRTWWKDEGPGFVLPGARATQPSTRPTTGPGR